MFPIEIVKSQKGKDKIIYKGYSYRKGNVNLKTINWRCDSEHCTGSISTGKNYNTELCRVKELQTHNHTPGEYSSKNKSETEIYCLQPNGKITTMPVSKAIIQNDLFKIVENENSETSENVRVKGESSLSLENIAEESMNTYQLNSEEMVPNIVGHEEIIHISDSDETIYNNSVTPQNNHNNYTVNIRPTPAPVPNKITPVNCITVKNLPNKFIATKIPTKVIVKNANYSSKDSLDSEDEDKCNLAINTPLSEMSIKERAQCVVWFIETKSDAQTQRNFKTFFEKKPPSRSTIRRMYKTFLETGSVQKFKNKCFIPGQRIVKVTKIQIKN